MSGRAYRHASATAGLCRLEHNFVLLSDATLALVSCKLAFRRESRDRGGLGTFQVFHMLCLSCANEHIHEKEKSKTKLGRRMYGQQSCIYMSATILLPCGPQCGHRLAPKHGWEGKDGRETRGDRPRSEYGTSGEERRVEIAGLASGYGAILR